jgi:zinc/manganese transport system substrate-binding protein
MKTVYSIIAAAAFAAIAAPASAALNVFACEPEWAALAQELGGDKLSVFSAVTPMRGRVWSRACATPIW